MPPARHHANPGGNRKKSTSVLDSSDDDHKVFVGGIPKATTNEEFRKIVQSWGFNTTSVYFQISTHFAWAVVKFLTPRERNNFLGMHEANKKKIGSMVLEIRAFKSNDKANDNAKKTAVTVPTTTRSSSGAEAIKKQGLPVGYKLASEDREGMHAAIISFDRETRLGVLQTDLGRVTGGKGLFHISAMTCCATHGLTCSDPRCATYKRFSTFCPASAGQKFSDSVSEHFERLFPLGTYVKIIPTRAPKNDERIQYQASVMWPIRSPPLPTSVTLLSRQELDEQMNAFMTGLMLKREKEDATRVHLKNNFNSSELGRVLDVLRFVVKFLKEACFLSHVENVELLPLARKIVKYAESSQMEGHCVFALLQFYGSKYKDITIERKDDAVAKFKRLFPALHLMVSVTEQAAPKIEERSRQQTVRVTDAEEKNTYEFLTTPTGALEAAPVHAVLPGTAFFTRKEARPNDPFMHVFFEEGYFTPPMNRAFGDDVWVAQVPARLREPARPQAQVPEHILQHQMEAMALARHHQ